MNRTWYALYAPRGLGRTPHGNELMTFPHKSERTAAIREMNEVFSPFVGGDVIKAITREEAKRLFPHKFRRKYVHSNGD